MSLYTGGSRSTDGHVRELEKVLGRKPNKYEVFKVLHWDKKENKWVDNRSQDDAMKMETRIVEDPILSGETNDDPSQRHQIIDDIYVDSAGGIKKQRVYGLGYYGSSHASSVPLSQLDIERIREEGRAEGRVEIQKKLDEVLVQQRETEDQVHFLMEHFGISRNVAPQAQVDDGEDLSEN